MKNRTLSINKKRELRKSHPCCSICGYNKYPEILEIHHNNFNPRDNIPENLLVICPTCHKEIHYQQEIEEGIKILKEKDILDKIKELE
jgi:5-methylcytosine-specific restriction endonuclease McrA